MTIRVLLTATALASALAAYVFRSIWAGYNAFLVTLPIRHAHET